MDEIFNYTITEVTKIFNLVTKKHGFKEIKTSNVNNVFGARIKVSDKKVSIDVVPTDVSVLIHLNSGADYVADIKTVLEVDKELSKIGKFITDYLN